MWKEKINISHDTLQTKECVECFPLVFIKEASIMNAFHYCCVSPLLLFLIYFNDFFIAAVESAQRGDRYIHIIYIPVYVCVRES